MNRVDRLFGILILMQSKKYTTAEKISEKFSISVRTVYRDIKALQEQGIPLSFEPHKGYFIVQGYFLPPVSFSMDEANALLLVAHLVDGFADQSIRFYYSAALTKIKAILKTGEKEKLARLNQHIKLQIPKRLDFSFKYLSQIQQAITERNKIVLEYKNNNEEVSKREVEAIGLIFYAFSWHLIGWCHLRNQYRDFNLTRIIYLKNLGIPFSKAQHISLNDYMHLLPVNY